ncbi:hypothetical protein [Spongiactinospora sp. TRM90649]|uniref:hypothetical protein n=1 Tax=Spongiactinospora sp. TRM90649 TaxID=3031114 RepID=UPI0023F66C79|nr:hypothetical protein [Spongiactinospora sp. TRM90649]MDF5756684.1 hypothetical protein [Spongiactinospora sp. TRM90649]
MGRDTAADDLRTARAMAAVALDAFERGESERARTATAIGMLHLRLAELQARLLLDMDQVPLMSRRRSSWEALLHEAGILC